MAAWCLVELALDWYAARGDTVLDGGGSGAAGEGPLKTWGSRIVVLSVVIGVLASTAGGSSVAASDPSHLVVLELFTSQGCSTCPPADRVLSRLGVDEKTRDQVLPLAFHVDYWNAGGWHDPFSAAAWSARQYAYGRALQVDGVYTPQLVVDGRTQINGGQEQRARAEIEAALARPPAARVTLAAHHQPTPKPSVTVDVGAEVVDSVDAGKLEVLVAVVESGLVTGVARGENGGHTLQNDFIVRRLETALSMKAQAGTRGQRTLTLTLRPEWKTENVSVAAFVQDPRSMRIYGAAAPVRLVSE